MFLLICLSIFIFSASNRLIFRILINECFSNDERSSAKQIIIVFNLYKRIAMPQMTFQPFVKICKIHSTFMTRPLSRRRTLDSHETKSHRGRRIIKRQLSFTLRYLINDHKYFFYSHRPRHCKRNDNVSVQ